MNRYVDQDRVLEYIIFGVVGKDITCGELKRAIESLPAIEVSEKTDDWTPVSEGSPKKEGEYIVSMGNDAFNTEGRVTWANYDIHKNQFYLPGGNVNYYINVSAWRPFPKPYKK